MDSKRREVSRFFQHLSGNPVTFEFIAGFLALILYIPDQVASVSSRHLAVAFNIPKETTGIYFSKLFSVRALVILFGSLATYILKWFISDDNIFFTLLFFSTLLISRFVTLLLLYKSTNLALDFYIVFIFESLCLGLFQLTFFALTPEYVSLSSLCFKVSKILVFLFQLAMDLTIFEKAFLMVKVHFFISFLITFIAAFFWIYYCLFNAEFRKNSIQQVALDDETSDKYSFIDASKCKIQIPPRRLTSDAEPSFATHLKNSISPFFMCIVSIMLKNILSPGLLPYALLERDQCHKINMAIIPMSLLGAFIIHVLKKTVKSINERWKWYWHTLWVFISPCVIVFVLTFAALHSDGPVSKRILNSQTSVLWMAIFFFFCFTFVEALGFLGVVSNVKRKGRVRGKGLKVVSTNQFTSYIIGFLFYKVSVGYNVTRSFGKIDPDITAPFNRFVLWVVRSIQGACNDFINDFHLNIKKYI